MNDLSAGAAAQGAPHARRVELRPEHAGRVGMISFLCSEVAFFGTLIVSYITFIGASKTGPTPAEALNLPLVIGATVALLSSSFTVHFAGGALHEGHNVVFRFWVLLTIALGLGFLGCTAVEWYELIVKHGLKIDTNLFGTSFYTLVGFHGLHVSIGLLLLTLMCCFSTAGVVTRERSESFELVSWYWHFVDAVWVVVFTVVYWLGR